MELEMDMQDEFRGRMSVEIEHLYERLADIETQLHELRALLAARLDSHERHHRENEHRWGLIQWCHRHPFRLVAIVASLAVALVGEIRDPLVRWLLGLLR